MQHRREPDGDDGGGVGVLEHGAGGSTLALHGASGLFEGQPESMFDLRVVLPPSTTSTGPRQWLK